MDQSFDIFFIVEEKEVRWMESCPSLDKAKVRVGELGFRLPGRYLILERPSGERTIVVSPTAKPER
jgi:hypothetical protein